MTEQCQHLEPEENDILLSLLIRFNNLFDGNPGTCNTKPVDLELKDDANPVC